jgi:hypothetical protein
MAEISRGRKWVIPLLISRIVGADAKLWGAKVNLQGLVGLLPSDSSTNSRYSRKTLQTGGSRRAASAAAPKRARTLAMSGFEAAP